MAIVTSRPSSVRATSSWQQSLKTAIREPWELCRQLELPDDVAAAAVPATRDFPLFAPLSFVAKMKPGDPADPLLLQVLPLADETAQTAGFSDDPVGDKAAKKMPGLLQKYHGRALLVTTGACAVHCRYCFRRHFPYDEAPRSPADWRAALAEIQRDESIVEVILSGGDPLMLVDSQLAELADKIAAIRHVRRLRVHTRLPVMIPERVTDELLDLLRGTRLTPIVVVHANHPAELADDVADSLARLVDAGIPLLNQSVLLRGVNDDAETLIALSERLIDLRVMPYYLHQLDRVSGAAHFEVSVERGIELLEQVRQRLPGYAVPRYVRDVAGQPNKVVLA